MLSIKIKASPGLTSFFNKYPSLYESARAKGTNKSLDLLQKESFDRAPYKQGTLRREIKQDYRNRRLVAGTNQSRPYAWVQENGMTIHAKGNGCMTFKTKDGSWHSVKQVTIKPKKFMHGALKDNTKKVLEIFSTEFRKVLSGK